MSEIVDKLKTTVSKILEGKVLSLFLVEKFYFIFLFGGLFQWSYYLLVGGGEKYMTQHKRRGKLPPRDRVDKLLDPG